MPNEPAGPQGPYASLYSSIRAAHRPKQPSTPGSERHRSERVPSRSLYAVCREAHLMVEELRAGQVSNLSAEGLALVLSRPFAIGTVLGVELQDAGGWVKSRVSARVVHSHFLSADRWVIGCSVLGEVAETETAEDDS